MSFARQYLRTTLDKRITFGLFDIKAKDATKISPGRWEKEMFSRLKTFYDGKVKDGLLEEGQNTLQNLSQEQQETVEELRTRTGKTRAGTFYHMDVNPKKNECRPATDTTGKCLMLECIEILEGLCEASTDFRKFKGFEGHQDDEEWEDVDDDDDDDNDDIIYAGNSNEENVDGKEDTLFLFIYYYLLL